MRVCAHRHVPVYVYTRRQNSEKSKALHSRTTPILQKSAFLSFNLPHEVQTQTASFRFWLCDAFLLPSLSS